MKYYDQVSRGFNPSFEDWKRRGVYVAQCATWKRAAELGLCSIHGFRALPHSRDNIAKVARDMVALSIRMDRLNTKVAA